MLVKELEKQKQNMARMIELTKRLMQVHDSKKQVADKIRNAKNEEEIINALNALIAANNARVSDNGKSCACAAGKAKAGSAPADS